MTWPWIIYWACALVYVAISVMGAVDSQSGRADGRD